MEIAEVLYAPMTGVHLAEWMVVYTTLAVLVETIAKSSPHARHGFGLKFAADAKYMRWRVGSFETGAGSWRKD
jgi:hypothetical protein